MKDYYAILGISRTAGRADVKRAFRRLANIYHPDHNPSAEAEGIIKDLIEAYEVLDDSTLRAQYDLLLYGGQPEQATAPTPPRHRDPRYRPRSVRKDYKSDNQVVIELIYQYAHYALYTSLFTLAFCMLLIIDVALPAAVQHETVTTSNVERRRSTDWRIYTIEGNEYSVSKSDISYFRRGASVTTAYSPILHVPFSVLNNQSLHEASILATIYRHYLFAPLVLLISSVVAIARRRAVVFSFNVAVMNGLVFMISFVFLLISRCHTI